MIAQEKQEKVKRKARRAIFIISFMIMPILNFLIFYLYVNIDSIFMAFQRIVNGEIIWTFDNFVLMAQEFTKGTSDLVVGLKNTCLTFLVQMVMFCIGFCVSVFLYKKIIGYQFYRVIFQLPGLVAGTVVATFFRRFFGPDNPGSNLFHSLFNIVPQVDLFNYVGTANLLVLLNLIWLSFPGDLIIWGGTLSRVPVSIQESAKLDGISWWREIVQIIVPMVWPTFSLKLILAFVGMLGASGNVFLLTGGNNGTMTLSCWMFLQVYNNGSSAMTNFNGLCFMSAMGLMMTSVSMIIYFIVRFITKRMDSEVTF